MPLRERVRRHRSRPGGKQGDRCPGHGQDRRSHFQQPDVHLPVAGGLLSPVSQPCSPFSAGETWAASETGFKAEPFASDSPNVRQPEEDAGPVTDVLGALAQARRCREQQEALERTLVRLARREGRTWSDIAEVYDITRQAAQYRFGR